MPCQLRSHLPEGPNDGHFRTSKRRSFRITRASRPGEPRPGADCIQAPMPVTSAGTSCNHAKTPLQRNRYQRVEDWGSEHAVDYPVHVNEGEGGLDASSTPQHRYDAKLAGDIERTWQ